MTTHHPIAGDLVVTPDGRTVEVAEVSGYNHPRCLRYVFTDQSFAYYDPNDAVVEDGLCRFVRYDGPTADWKEMFRATQDTMPT